MGGRCNNYVPPAVGGWLWHMLLLWRHQAQLHSQPVRCSPCHQALTSWCFSMKRRQQESNMTWDSIFMSALSL